MSSILYSSGTLPFFESLEEQHRFKEYTYGHKAPIAIGLNRIPPFQIVVPLGMTDINSVRVIKEADGTDVDKYSVMSSIGFETKTFPNYKIIRWTGTASIPGSILSKGTYYLILTNGVQTFYSDEFVMTNELDDFIKVEFCHSEDFPLPGGLHIDYDDYRNFFFFRTKIGKPDYVFENKAEDRDGFTFFEQQVRFKRSRFEIFLPEEVADTVSLIGLHDTVTIFDRAKVHHVDEFSMSADWLERGDVAAVEIEFKTDTVSVVNGKGIAAGESCGSSSGDGDGGGGGGGGDGDCFPVTYQAAAFIDEGSAEWNGEYYVNSFGVQIPFADGDLAVVYRREVPFNNQIWLFEYTTAGGFNPSPTNPGEYVFDQNSGQYFYDNNEDSLLYNHIEDVVGNLVTGQAIPISTVELWAELADGSEILLAVTDSFEFTDTGITFTPPETPIVALQIRCSSATCDLYFVSSWFPLDPFGLISCSTTYVDDPSASSGGVEPGGFYCLDIANIFGMMEGLVKRLEPFTGYSSDAAAVATVGANVVYQMAENNDLGVPSGICRIKADGLDVYDGDASAAAGGVLVGEFYCYNPAGPTVDNYCFVKKRSS